VLIFAFVAITIIDTHEFVSIKLLSLNHNLPCSGVLAAHKILVTLITCITLDLLDVSVYCKAVVNYNCSSYFNNLAPMYFAENLRIL